MVRLYTSGKYFKDNEIIIDNDSFFNNNVSAKSLSENSIKVMEEVDHAKLLDQNIGENRNSLRHYWYSGLVNGVQNHIELHFSAREPEGIPDGQSD